MQQPRPTAPGSGAQERGRCAGRFDGRRRRRQLRRELSLDGVRRVVGGEAIGRRQGARTTAPGCGDVGADDGNGCPGGNVKDGNVSH